jgi:TrmH family RNA methyltransferase
MERIASRQNPLVRRFRALAAEGVAGEALLDGPHLVEEALRSGLAVEVVAIADRVAETLAPVAREAARLGARVVQVSDAALEAMSPVRHPSGVVAIAQCGPASLAACLEPQPALLIVLAGVQDAGNVGAIVRAAEGCGASAVICTHGTANPYGWKALRGAMGSTFRLPVAVHQSLPATIDALKAGNITLLATLPRGGTPLDSTDLRRPVAVLLGAEGTGMPTAAAAGADAQLTIPMRPPVDSLNVAIAAALILYEASRQRKAH